MAEEQHGLTDQNAPAFISQIHAAHYDPRGGWSAERSIDIKSGLSTGPQLEINANGDAMAIWVETVTPSDIGSLYTSSYTASHGWSSPQRVASDGQLGPDPKLSFDPVGNALAVWTALGTQLLPPSNYPNQTFATRYVSGRGWVGSPDNIDNCGQAATAAAYGPLCDQYGQLRSFGPEVKFDANGNAIAAWVETDIPAQFQRAFANRYVGTTGSWGTPQPLSDDAVSGRVQLAVDHSGNAFAIWSTGFQIRLAAYTVATGWGAAQSLGPATQQEPEVAFDASGNALAVWTNTTSYQGFDTMALYAARYTPAGGWASPVRVDCADSNPADASQACPGSIVDPQIAFDTGGNAFAVWSYLEIPQAYHNEAYRQGQIYANRYILNNGWDTPQSIDIKADLARKPQVTVDANGHALAIWSEGGNIYVNRFE
jgi:hypothetical protein